MANGNSASRKTLDLVTQIAVAILLPGVGFLASQVIENGKSHARIDERVLSIEKQQGIRDENLRRELREIKDTLSRMAKK